MRSTTRRLIRTLLALAAVAAAGCVRAPSPRQPAAPEAGAVAVPDHVRVRVEGRTEQMALEDYVLGSVLAEFSPVGESPDTARRILEVQAILARTYAAANVGRHGAEGFDLCDATHCQLYEPARLRTSQFAGTARAAVAATHGRVLAFAGRPVQALYHADCGGMLAAAEDVWGGDPVSYLPGSPDAVPASTHRHWVFERPLSTLLEVLDGDSRSTVGRALSGIAVVRIDSSGRAAEVAVQGDRTVILRGETLRAILNSAFGPTAIRSTRFSVARNGDQFTFTGTGYGHGVGLCQVGAAARARRGEPVETILAAYYPGARLTTAVR